MPFKTSEGRARLFVRIIGALIVSALTVFGFATPALAIDAKTSPTFALDASHNAVTITLNGGTFKPAPIVAADFQFTGTSSSALASGIFTRTSDTVVTISGISGLSGSNNAVEVKATTQATQATSVTAEGSTIAVSTPEFTLTASHNSVAITLSGGTFKPAPISASDFTFSGASASKLSSGTFERTSASVVTISGISGLSGTNNLVTVKASSMVQGAASVGAAGAKIDVQSEAFSLSASDNTVVVTLSGGTFKAAAPTAADFVFDGTSKTELEGGVFSRTSDTAVTISGLNGLSGTDNTVKVLAGSMVNGAASVTAAGGTGGVTTPAFTLTAAHNAVTVTLTGGTFKAEPITAADFTFAGASASKLAAGTFTRTGSSVVRIAGVSGLSGTNNTITVKAGTMATGAASAAGVGTTIDVTSAEYTLTAAFSSVVITLTGGTFKSGAIAAGDFTFAGTSAAAIAAGSFARTSDTVVTISGLSSLSGADNTVTVKAATMSGGAATVAASGSVSAVTSATFALTSAHNSVNITLTDGSFRTGSFSASDFTFAGTSAAQLALGTFTRSSTTLVTITGISGLGGSDNTVTIKGTALSSQATVVTGTGALVPVTSPAFTLTNAFNAVTITLVGGTFKAGTINASNFTFGGTSATKLAEGTFTRTSDTVVTISDLSGLTGTDNSVTVKTSTMATGAASVAGAGETAPVTSPVFTLTAAHNTVTVTLTGGTFKAGTIAASDFTFAGTSATTLAAGTFTRTSDTVVTITGLAGLSGTNNTVAVKTATMATAAESVAAAGSLTAVTSAAFTLSTTSNTVTITLTGGTFKSGTIEANDFTFAGTSATLLAAGTFTRTSDTVVTISGLTGLSGTNNTVLVKAATMANGAASVAATGALGAVTSGTISLNSSHNAVTITLTGGTFKSGAITASDFTFAGSAATALAAGTFTRSSDTVVTISGLSGLSGSTTTVLVKAATMATGATSVAGAGTTVAVTSSEATFNSTFNTVTITLTGGTFKSGSIVAGDFIITGTSATTLAAGTFNRISDTVVTITGLTGLSGSNNAISVRPATMATGASAVSMSGSLGSVSSAALSLTSASNALVITLAGGTFKAGTIAASDFTFSGTSAAALAAGRFTRTSDTVVTITGISGLSGTDNRVTVNAATMASAATGVTAVGTTVDVTSAAFTMANTFNTLTITLTGGTFRAAPVLASDFIVAGPSAISIAAGSFKRVSDTVVTISGVSGLLSVGNTVTVKAATMVNGASAVSVAGTVQTPPAGPIGGVARVTKTVARYATKVSVIGVPTATTEAAPRVVVRAGSVVALRVSGVMAFETYRVQVWLGSGALTLANFQPTSRTGTLPAFRAVKKGTYFIQLTDSAAAQRFIRLVVR